MPFANFFAFERAPLSIEVFYFVRDEDANCKRVFTFFWNGITYRKVSLMARNK